MPWGLVQRAQPMCCNEQCVRLLSMLRFLVWVRRTHMEGRSRVDDAVLPFSVLLVLLSVGVVPNLA